MSVSKEELKEELRHLEHRLDEKFASRQDLADVKVELLGAMRHIADELKRHFDFTVEQIRSDKNDAAELQLADHEHRLQKLESRT